MAGSKTAWRAAIGCAALVALVASGCGKKASAPAKNTEGAGAAADNTAKKAENKGAQAPAAANKADKTGKNAEPAAKPAPPPAAVTVDVARVVPAIAAADLQAVFSAWLSAQNDGDFDAYSKLYAERFVGIKRSGARTRSFKREGWLRDRKRMFAKAMKVEAARMEMSATAESAVISFEQAWASGSYKDVGPKQLVIIKTPNGLRLAREEMLRSELAAGEAKAKPLSARTFGFIVHSEEHAYVVLSRNVDSAWAAGRPKVLSMSPHAVTVRDVNAAKLPAEIAKIKGLELRLNGPSGQVCRGVVDKLVVMGRVTPHFSTIGYWRGEEGGRPLPSQTIAKEAWSLGDTGRLVVGRIKPVKANICRGAVWAHDASAPEPTILGPVTPSPLLIRAAQRAFRKLKGYREIQKSYLEMTKLPRAEHWDRFNKSAPSIQVLGSKDGLTKYVAVSAHAGDGCGDFIGEYWAIWRVKGTDDKPSLVLMTDDRAPGRFFVPRLATDLDGDGTHEFISADGLLQPVGPVLRESQGIEVPNLDCPC